jgi:hypothetical protein
MERSKVSPERCRSFDAAEQRNEGALDVKRYAETL